MNRFKIHEQGLGLVDFIGKKIQLKLTGEKGIDKSQLSTVTKNNEDDILFSGRWEFPEPITSDVQLKYDKVLIYLESKSDPSAEVEIPSSQVISNCKAYKLILKVTPSNEIVFIEDYKITVSSPYDSDLSSELLTYTPEEIDDFHTKIIAPDLMEAMNRGQVTKSTIHNNMFELRKLGYGMIICGERIIDKDFMSYKFIPYPELIESSWTLYYSTYEAQGYAYRINGDKLEYKYLPTNVRKVNVDQITQVHTLTIPKDYILKDFCGESGMICVHKDKASSPYSMNCLVTKSQITYTGSESRYINPINTRPVLVSTNESTVVTALIEYHEDRSRFLRRHHRSDKSEKIYDIKFDIIITFCPSENQYKLYHKNGMTPMGLNIPLILSDECYVSSNGKIMNVSGQEESEYRFNYFMKNTPGHTGIMRYGSALYLNFNNTKFELI